MPTSKPQLHTSYQATILFPRVTMPIRGEFQPCFSYPTLDKCSDEIRLCKIQKAPPDAPIRLELFTVSLSDDNLRYHALSYMWGEHGDRWIYVNNTAFIIRPNLLAALKAIRKLSEDTVLWIDAICIDQLAVSEKNHQVSRMGEIYQNAMEVFIWLGDGSNTTDSLLDDINNQKEVSPTALNDILERSYWKRLWIQQEVTLAKHIRVFCGSKSVTWDTLASLIAARKDPLQSKGAEFQSRPLYDSEARTLLEYRKKLWGDESLTLLELLAHSNTSECFDCRDKVFGLLSIASDCKQLRADMVDYSLDPVGLFLGVKRFYFQKQSPFVVNMLLQTNLRINIHRFLQAEDFTTWSKRIVALQPGTKLGSRSFFFERASVLSARIIDFYQDPGLLDIFSSSQSLQPAYCCLESGSEMQILNRGKGKVSEFICSIPETDVFLIFRYSGTFLLLETVTRNKSTRSPIPAYRLCEAIGTGLPTVKQYVDLAMGIICNPAVLKLSPNQYLRDFSSLYESYFAAHNAIGTNLAKLGIPEREELIYLYNPPHFVWAIIFEEIRKCHKVCYYSCVALLHAYFVPPPNSWGFTFEEWDGLS
ncbi:heterokaryon incompatibility protein (HET) domain-containing protein [Pochonia chlamydosporia 170]|uniref:Heterokaryon incompatibility protein (HET) domain-containing protein n=1 Tax=Pochonia chlamydosporia 170 TaxID=1380566 RepID=A0A179FF92_METCM|nr:heterokaryon incompatibility protein (HET) domain-containing protein [Pochonia chlamydosporia 170]OAQ63723.1 heterokaryon incompatibility protein (HET) domain-containing protein [Pochonia chlamydosporia 170]